MKVIFSHSIAFILLMIGLGILSSFFYRAIDSTWLLSGILMTGVIVISALDYLDILRFRKSKVRLTKCTVCGRTYKSSEYSKDSETEIKTKISGGKDTKKSSVKKSQKKEQFLNGIIVHDRLICETCLEDSDRVRKKL